MSEALIFDVNWEEFEQQVIQASHTTPILLDLWADWCPPCIAIAPVLKQVAEARKGQIRLAKVDVDEGDNMKIAGRYQARGFPTILLIVNGEERDRFYSAKPRSFVEQFIDRALQGGA